MDCWSRTCGSIPSGHCQACVVYDNVLYRLRFLTRQIVIRSTSFSVLSSPARLGVFQSATGFKIAEPDFHRLEHASFAWRTISPSPERVTRL
jgi:hypothetical protein